VSLRSLKYSRWNAHQLVHFRTYDWNSHIVPGTPLDRLDFVPMAWGSGSADGFAADSANFDALGVSHLLSFNEPDVSHRPTAYICVALFDNVDILV
jgi:hypothetical protein